METRCLNCNKLLTSSQGGQLFSANYNSALPSIPAPKKMTAGVILYARCDECMKLAMTIAYREGRVA